MALNIVNENFSGVSTRQEVVDLIEYSANAVITEGEPRKSLTYVNYSDVTGITETARTLSNGLIDFSRVLPVIIPAQTAPYYEVDIVVHLPKKPSVFSNLIILKLDDIELSLRGSSDYMLRIETTNLAKIAISKNKAQDPLSPVKNNAWAYNYDASVVVTLKIGRAHV